jgi:hypothetical protein
MAVGVGAQRPQRHRQDDQYISTRTRLDSAGDVVIAGFVIEDRPRTVLVRTIGPSLVRFDVTSAHPDRWLAIKRGNQTLGGNDDW